LFVLCGITNFGCISVCDAPVTAPKAKKYDSYNPDTYKTDEMKKEEV